MSKGGGFYFYSLSMSSFAFGKLWDFINYVSCYQGYNGISVSLSLTLIALVGHV